jgi:hypothetical protein
MRDGTGRFAAGVPVQQGVQSDEHRPLSFVQIDARQRKLSAGTWKDEFDRPIYFVELRDEYVCSWCELRGKNLLLIPSPQSREPVRQLRFPMDAEIVGRVTAVTMNITEVAK